MHYSEQLFYVFYFKIEARNNHVKYACSIKLIALYLVNRNVMI